ncbi:MAG: hypothetical protein JW943_04660 [Deltaproteobacteria bacterium]|nr:hypothetical protein [Deltaproteobacteria bacterium]
MPKTKKMENTENHRNNYLSIPRSRWTVAFLPIFALHGMVNIIFGLYSGIAGNGPNYKFWRGNIDSSALLYFPTLNFLLHKYKYSKNYGTLYLKTIPIKDRL